MSTDERITLYDLETLATDELRDAVADERVHIDDAISEICDRLVPVYYSDLLRLACAHPDLALREPELGPAYDGRPTPVNIIAANIYEHLSSHLYEQLHNLDDEGDDDDERRA